MSCGVRVAPAPPQPLAAEADGVSATPPTEATEAAGDEGEARLPPFRPLPALLVFPNLPLLAFWCFALGLTKKSTALLAFSHANGGIACHGRCKLAATLTLVLVGGVVLLGLAMVLRFSRHHRSACWKPKKRPAKPNDVADPFFRLWSQAKACARCQPVHREQGVWNKPPEDLAEPARTERLLAHGALNPFYARASDCQESMAITLMAHCTGRLLVGQLFAWCGIVLQAAMGVLCGVGPYLEPGGHGAKFQVLAVGVLKCGWAMLLALCMPHANLLMNTILALIFTCEGVSVLLLFCAQWAGATAEAIDVLQLVSFWLLLVPVFLPILQKLYDAVFVAIIFNCVRKNFDWAKVVHTLVMLLCAIPKFLMVYFGVKTSAGGAMAASAGAQVGKTTKHLLADLKRQRKATEAQSRMIEARKTAEQRAADGPVGACTAAGIAAHAQRSKCDNGDDGDDGDDGGDGGDGGDL